MFVSVAVNIPSEKTFSYAVPEILHEEVSIGKRVLAPFGKRRLTGYIVEISKSAPREDTKEIIEILDLEPLFNETDLKFYQWVSQYYMYPPGKALSEILPGGIDPKSDQWISLAKEEQERPDARMSPSQRRIIDTLTQYPDGISLTHLRKMFGKQDVTRDVNSLKVAGFITTEYRTKKPQVSRKKEKIITLTTRNLDALKLTKKQHSLVDLLRGHGSLPFLFCAHNSHAPPLR